MTNLRAVAEQIIAAHIKEHRDSWDIDFVGLGDAIEAALKAERERCAKIAEGYDSGYKNGDMADEIAKSIHEGWEPPACSKGE
jgi:hypothetical protein